MSRSSTLVDLDTRPDEDTSDVRATPRDARFAAVVAVLALVAGLAYAPPWRVGGDIPVGFAGRFQAGDLQVEESGEWVDVPRGELLADGSTVRSERGADIQVENGTVSLGAASRAVLDPAVELEAGSLLVSVDQRERAVQVGALTASGRGTWRVDAAGATRVGVYSGSVDIGGPSATGLAVDSLRQASLTGGSLPERTLPLAYGNEDPWDQRFLAGIIATDRQVARLERALTAEFGTGGRPGTFYETFAPVEGAIRDALSEFVSPAADGGLGPPADVLLSVVVTDLIVDAVGLEVEEAIGKVVELRRDGATWGLLLAIYGLGGDDLRAAVDETLRGPALEAAREAIAAADAASSTGTNAGAGSGQAPAPGEGDAGDGPRGEGPFPDAPGEPPLDPDDPCQAQECEPVEDAVGDLTGVLDDAPAPTGDTSDDPDPLPSLPAPTAGPGIDAPDAVPSVSAPTVEVPGVEAPSVGSPSVDATEAGSVVPDASGLG